jgi:predicted RecA/RadA family phage recombinase
MADAGRRTSTGEPYTLTLESAISARTVVQLPDGRAAISMASGSPDDQARFNTTGVWPLVKTAGVVILPGGRCYWDYSANAVTFKKASDRDFFVGICIGGAASADAEVSVDLNREQVVDIDLMRDPFTTELVGTPAAGGFGYPVRLGGAMQFELSATNEAQKVDALSVDSFSVDANPIVEIIFRVTNDGAAGSQDVSLGITNGTHPSDADSITQAMLVHLDGNNTNINLESRDGTSTPVASTDTTKDYTEGAAYTDRREVWLDFSNPLDVQAYVEGVNVLPSSVFDVDAATGPLKAIVHLEKSASADVYVLQVDRFTVRFKEQ